MYLLGQGTCSLPKPCNRLAGGWRSVQSVWHFMATAAVHLIHRAPSLTKSPARRAGQAMARRLQAALIPCSVPTGQLLAWTSDANAKRPREPGAFFCTRFRSVNQRRDATFSQFTQPDAQAAGVSDWESSLSIRGGTPRFPSSQDCPGSSPDSQGAHCGNRCSRSAPTRHSPAMPSG